MTSIRHQPAFAGQIARLFHLRPDAYFLDLTLGDGSHSEEALEAGAKVVSLDVDPEAISRATEFLSSKFTPIIVQPEMKATIPFDFHWLIIHANFKDIGQLKKEFKLPLFDAILADLGTSQHQLQEQARGFSFNTDGALDMRLDKRLAVTASDLVNALPEKELEQLLLLADEHFAKPIVRAIIRERKIAPIVTTVRLAQIIATVKRPIKGKIHPATKTFMALRMAVNLEREALTQMLSALPELISEGGIIGIISFHSGEDRLVKRFFKAKQKEGILRLINVKPIKPDENELQHNPKVRSAKLRLAQRL